MPSGRQGEVSVDRVTLSERIRSRDLRIQSAGPLAYTLSAIAHYGVRAVLGSRVQRDRDHVLNEYDVQSRNEYWDSELSLDQLIYGDDRTAKWLLKDGVLVVGIDRVSREYLTQRLLSRVSEYLPDGKGTIVEFGCGTGRNLFFLRRHFPEARLVGFELSPRTAARAQRDADAFGLDIEVIQADMTSPLGWDGRASVSFTVHALEQLPRVFTKAVDQILSITDRAVIFFEPVLELFPVSLRGLAARLRLRNADHLSGLLTYLRQNGAGRVVVAEPLPTVGAPLNQTSELVVEIS